MRRHTVPLRILLVLLALCLLAAVGILAALADDAARTYPEIAYLQWPFFTAIVIGCVPFIVVMFTTAQLLRQADRNEAFSARTVSLLRRIKLSFAGAAGYLFVGYIAAIIALSKTGPGPGPTEAMLFGETVLLFLTLLAAVLQRLFAAATELRFENELTV